MTRHAWRQMLDVSFNVTFYLNLFCRYNCDLTADRMFQFKYHFYSMNCESRIIQIKLKHTMSSCASADLYQKLNISASLTSEGLRHEVEALKLFIPRIHSVTTTRQPYSSSLLCPPSNTKVLLQRRKYHCKCLSQKSTQKGLVNEAPAVAFWRHHRSRDFQNVCFVEIITFATHFMEIPLKSAAFIS